MWQKTLKLVPISILNGILLGIFGATAAHYFRPEFIPSNNALVIVLIMQIVLFYFFVVSVLLHL